MRELCLIVVSILSVEYLCRVPLTRHVTHMGLVAKKSSRVMTSPRISDHWKERVLLRYSGQLVMETIRITGWFFLWMLAVVAVDRLCVYGFQISLLNYAASLWGLVIATVSATLWWFARSFVAR